MDDDPDKRQALEIIGRIAESVARGELVGPAGWVTTARVIAAQIE